MLDNLIKYIKSVTVNGKEVSNNGNNIEIKKNIGKYSSSKVPTINLELNNIKLKRTDKVTYECPKCHEYSTIGIGRFLGKKTEYCYP